MSPHHSLISRLWVWTNLWMELWTIHFFILLRSIPVQSFTRITRGRGIPGGGWFEPRRDGLCRWSLNAAVAGRSSRPCRSWKRRDGGCWTATGTAAGVSSIWCWRDSSSCWWWRSRAVAMDVGTAMAWMPFTPPNGAAWLTQLVVRAVHPASAEQLLRVKLALVPLMTSRRTIRWIDVERLC